ncbi:OmpH family outer membrane protein [Sulfitobacter sp. PR48]|uniref:OmpH family outer membrane protein n=1 Tax=Sulfitobacter sp. PR48 TaxID=3028383 RepID=UPI00237C23FB|nr:OmpH family outer membrane protein [Sulfitobacter sp. PR48]MDD9722635.1 OmpH family outer membrane protein [Sulfitobacter sp. PR48]
MGRLAQHMALVLALLCAAPLAAQSTAGPAAAPERGSVVSPVLTIDSERVFQQSDFGKRVAAEEREKLSALESENREIEARLETEERALTEKRAQMTPEAFRVLADAFDAKVQETRSAQDAKFRELSAQLDVERGKFQQAAAPVFEQLMREAGAAVILERRSVFASATVIEITEEAIALLNETLGDGAGAEDR